LRICPRSTKPTLPRTGRLLVPPITGFQVSTVGNRITLLVPVSGTPYQKRRRHLSHQYSFIGIIKVKTWLFGKSYPDLINWTVIFLPSALTTPWSNSAIYTILIFDLSTAPVGTFWILVLNQIYWWSTLLIVFNSLHWQCNNVRYVTHKNYKQHTFWSKCIIIFQ